MSRHRLFPPLVAGVALALVASLAACSPQAAPPPKNQELTVALAVPPISLDPHGAQAVEEGVQTIGQQFLEPLVRLQDSEYVPDLAASWTNPDDLTWVFTLRKGVTFSDGSPLTAADVKASAERVIKLQGAALAPLWAPVASIEATDAQTVTIKTTAPLGTLLSVVSLLMIGPADRIDTPDFWLKPIGTGPFVVDAFVPNESVVMSRNDKYWGKAPALDKLTFTYIPEVSGRITALETGEVDVMTSVAPDQVPQLQSDDQISYLSEPSSTYYFDWFNSSRAPFNDPKVREALWHAVDVDSIVKDLFGGTATVAQAPIPQGVFGASKQKAYSYDPKLAKQLLADAGYPNGFSTTLQFPQDSGPQIKALAQVMISDWAKIGVTVAPLEKERAQWITDLNALNWDMNLQTNTVLTGDADYSLGRLYLCSAKRNGYCNPDLDKLLLSARATIDPDTRKDLYAKASKIIWDDAVGIFPMDLATNAAVRDRVKGFKLAPNGRPSYAGVSVTS
jgi:peptide/nickel transport system substrate-binding protein